MVKSDYSLRWNAPFRADSHPIHSHSLVRLHQFYNGTAHGCMYSTLARFFSRCGFTSPITFVHTLSISYTDLGMCVGHKQSTMDRVSIRCGGFSRVCIYVHVCEISQRYHHLWHSLYLSLKQRDAGHERYYILLALLFVYHFAGAKFRLTYHFFSSYFLCHFRGPASSSSARPCFFVCLGFGYLGSFFDLAFSFCNLLHHIPGLSIQ